MILWVNSLHMNQIQLSDFDQRLMNLHTMGSFSITPTCYGSLIQTKYMPMDSHFFKFS
jgi:hypothetical protein